MVSLGLLAGALSFSHSANAEGDRCADHAYAFAVYLSALPRPLLYLIVLVPFY